MRYLVTFLFSFVSETFSQQRFVSVEGTVKAPNGKAAAFTSVQVKHYSNTTTAGGNGWFKLNGIKIGDTLVFTNTGYKRSYFVVDRKYNKIDLTLLIDTVIVFAKRQPANTNLSFVAAYLRNNPYVPATFSETSATVLDEKRPDDNMIFTKVEVSPGFHIRSQVFDKDLDSTINKLPKKYKPKKSAVVNVYYWIRAEAKIEVSHVESPYKEEVNNFFKAIFGRVHAIYPAIQNGRKVAVFCVTKFELYVNKDKSISIKILRE